MLGVMNTDESLNSRFPLFRALNQHISALPTRESNPRRQRYQFQDQITEPLSPIVITLNNGLYVARM